MDKTTSVTLSDEDRQNIEALKGNKLINPRITDMRMAISYALAYAAMFSGAPQAAPPAPRRKREQKAKEQRQ